MSHWGAARCEGHEDFDRLLDESSLSTGAAKKNQAETPSEVYQCVQDHLRDSEVACRHVDVDDFLLHLVRLYSVSNDASPTSSTPVNTALSARLWTPRHGFPWRPDSDFTCQVRADVVPGIMQTLLDLKVFSYLRQDVARSLVSLCFNSRTPLPPAILNVCASAVPASSLTDELADAFMNMMQTERTALPTNCWPKRPEEQDAIYHAGLRVRRQPPQTLTITRSVNVTVQPLPHDQTSTTDLLSRACDRDLKAWEEIMRRYRKLVSTTVRSFGLQHTDARDAVQRTWLRLAENFHRIQFPEHLGGWLATTARHECLRILRQQTQHALTSPDAAKEWVADPSMSPEHHAVDADTAARLRCLVTTSSPRRQALIRELVATNPRPYAEVARNPGIPTGGIGLTRARALSQLRRRLADAHPELVVVHDHDDKIQEVVLCSQGGQLLAIASHNSTAQIEDISNGNELIIVHDQDSPILQDDQIQTDQGTISSDGPSDSVGTLGNRSPRVFVSYTHDSDYHKGQVLQFSTFLQSQGIVTNLDQLFTDRRRDWYAGAIKHMTEADFVIVVASPGYRRAGDGNIPSHQNRGIQSEASLLRDLLCNDRETWLPKLLPVILPGHTPDDIPLFLQPYTADHYWITEFTTQGAEDLLRVITAQPGYLRPPLGIHSRVRLTWAAARNLILVGGW